GRVRELDALVVDLDLLARLEVVVHDHAPAPPDQGPAHLDRGQPVHVDVGDQVRLEEQGQGRGGRGWAGHVAQAGGRHRLGVWREHVIHDGQVVHGEVPDHVDVVLEEPEVHADRDVVVDLAQRVAGDELLDPPHGARVHEGVVDHQHATAPLRL